MGAPIGVSGSIGENRCKVHFGAADHLQKSDLITDLLGNASADYFIVADWRKDDVVAMKQKADCGRCGGAEAVRMEIEESECDASSQHPQAGVDIRHVVTA